MLSLNLLIGAESAVRQRRIRPGFLSLNFTLLKCKRLVFYYIVLSNILCPIGLMIKFAAFYDIILNYEVSEFFI
ncbi:hypothetical protein [Leptospira noguchii]|uniref:hypothetical protein n=1 Tax=Leptospira noguchii TaxID=28182 RepID=UPI003B9699D3